MKYRIPKALYIAPFIYLLITGYFLFSYFNNSRGFSDRSGSIQISGSFRSGTTNRESGLSSLKVNCGVFHFSFPSGTPLYRMEGEEKKNITLRGYKKEENELQILFENEIKITIATTDNIEMTISTPGELQEDQFFLGYRLTNNTILEQLYSLPVYALNQHRNAELQSQDYSGMVLYDCSLATDTQTIIFYPSSDSFRIQFLKNEDLLYDGMISYLADLTTMKQPAADEQDLAKLKESIYTGWTETRYNRSVGRWLSGAGDEIFDERIIAYVLAEGKLNGTFSRYLDYYRNTLTWHATMRTGESSIYTGGISSAGIDYFQKQQSRVENILEWLNGDTQLLLQDMEAASLLLQFGKREEAEKLARVIESHTIRDNSDGFFLIRWASVLEDAGIEINGTDVKRIVSEGIFPQIAITESGLVGVISPTISSRQIINAATALQKLSALPVEIKNLGTILQNSLLNQADESGFIPEYYFLEDEGPISSGKTAPEQYYEILYSNPFIPKFLSFNLEGTTAVAFASESNLEISRSNGITTLSLINKVGETYEIAVYNLPEFTSLEMFDTPWPTDPSFERYSSGWARNNGIFTLKLQHKQSQERIILR